MNQIMTQNEGEPDIGDRWQLHHANTDGSVKVDLAQLRLKPGLELTILDKLGRILNDEAQFMAALPGKGVLISLLPDRAENIEMRAGEDYYISGFTGKFSFTFTTTVLRVDRMQFTALVSCPDSAVAHFVRKHLRTKLNLPATISVGGKSATPAVISNLSVAGAGLDTSAAFGACGDQVTLTLQVMFERRKLLLNLTSVIRHVTENGHADTLRTGVDFVNASQYDKLLLHYHITTLAELG